MGPQGYNRTNSKDLVIRKDLISRKGCKKVVMVIGIGPKDFKKKLGLFPKPPEITNE